VAISLPISVSNHSPPRRRPSSGESAPISNDPCVDAIDTALIERNIGRDRPV
jgi:hypothetical protein